MGRVGNFKPSYEQCHMLHIKSFTASKAFAKNKNFNAIFRVWERWGFADNSLFVKYKVATQLLEVCFFKKGKRYDQTIKIVALETNLKNGYRYYFVCLHTGKRCTKLLRPAGNTQFLHKTAWKGLYYEQQKESKQYRAIKNSEWGLGCLIDNLERELYWERPKYQKTHYRGKPTPKHKKLARLQAKQQEANNEYMYTLKGYEAFL